MHQRGLPIFSVAIVCDDDWERERTAQEASLTLIPPHSQRISGRSLGVE